MKDTGKVVILVTAGSEEDAHRVAEHLLGRRKAACVNIVPRTDSLFWWQGKLESVRKALAAEQQRNKETVEATSAREADLSKQIKALERSFPKTSSMNLTWTWISNWTTAAPLNRP